MSAYRPTPPKKMVETVLFPINFPIGSTGC